MALFKCKICGGNVELAEDKTFGTCEYCGSSMTFPKINDEQRTAAFNRGNHFRRIGEFDKALDIYEQIVREDETDAEAHWCCALCRFGVEYVEDPNAMEYIPTCHRVSFDNFLEDVDYLAALEYSDGITKRQYQKDGAKIAEVQRGILAASQKEKPFDVFLCYKETDENGQRTKDSVLAQDVYYQLTDLGYRVFFSRITLEDVAGKQYEPYIFAALNSAKVMVVIGTKPEYMNAAWVKNEWSRFLAMVKKDRSKLLLPCYRDMAPYEMPEPLSVLQSYDMGKIGFLQDLIRGIKKVLDEPQKPVPVIAKTEDRQEKRQNYVALLLIALIFVSIVAIGAILWAAGVFDARQPGEEVLPTPTITTLPEEIPCEALDVSAERYLLQSIGDTEVITCLKMPANSTEVISFRSEDTTVATVDGNGTITAVNIGTTNIIITCGKVTFACEVIVGDGRTSAAVPLLIGKDIQEAKRILQEKGFPEPRINKVYSSQPADTVVDQNPSANTVVSTETVVVLDVSKGPKPVETAPPTPKPTPQPTEEKLVVYSQYGLLDYADLALREGETAKLYLGNDSGTRITTDWTCLNNDFIKVSGNTITAVKSTNMTPITIRTVYEGKTYTCIIRVG